MLKLAGKDGNINISTSRYAQWCSEYKACNVLYEIAQANRWLEQNTSKRWKTLKGFEKWLERADRQALQNPKAYKFKIEAWEKPADANNNYWTRREKVQDETSEKQEGVRASDDVVAKHIATLKEMLPVEVIEQSKEVASVHCSHEWDRSFYTGGRQCVKCRAFDDQWLSQDFIELSKIARRAWA